MTKRELFQAALALSDEDRAKLRDELDQSLEVELPPALLASVKEREAAFDRGEPGSSGETVFARLRER